MRKRPMRVWADKIVPFNYYFAAVNPDTAFFQYTFDTAGIVSGFVVHCIPNPSGMFSLEFTNKEGSQISTLTLEKGIAKFGSIIVNPLDLISCSIVATEEQTRNVHIGFYFEGDEK